MAEDGLLGKNYKSLVITDANGTVLEKCLKCSNGALKKLQKEDKNIL